VPVANPTKPNTIMNQFLKHISLLAGNVTRSMTAGRIRARNELANAPISDIRRSRCGTRADNPPEMIIKQG
jgi:hypothetical protein